MKKYDPQQTWLQNLQGAPERPVNPPAVLPIPGDWTWCGLPLDSPLGIPAGPLLDSRWLRYYAHLGFDWLVYKTVRTTEYPCLPLPNLVPVESPQLVRPGTTLVAQETTQPSWAVSFGMPSQAPDVWRADVELARDRLPDRKRLIVSVVATQDSSLVDPEASLEQIADDYALCARWAMESGADGVVANFSCPNVTTADGQLYQQPSAAGQVAARIRQGIGSTPLALKIGWLPDEQEARLFVDEVAPWVDGLIMTNAISAYVRDAKGELLFQGGARGICGDAIRQASIQQVDMFRGLMDDRKKPLAVIGVGGISHVEHVQSYLDAGAQCVGIATAAMLNPTVGLEIRSRLYPPGAAGGGSRSGEGERVDPGDAI